MITAKIAKGNTIKSFVLRPIQLKCNYHPPNPPKQKFGHWSRGLDSCYYFEKLLLFAVV